MKAEIAKESADRIQFTIEQRFASGKNNVLHAERSYRCLMPIEIGGMTLAPILSLPDVAHHAAAVALTREY